MANVKGKIGVTTENIFPVIKQFLYSDHEIFLRELVANAVDASQKMKTLAANAEYKGELGDLNVKIELDQAEKVLKITDRGIGMTEEEVDKYINQIAFSSAGEFLDKYKDQSIIGHFGLGFYSAFMVAKQVSIDTLSWKEGASAVRWTCDGSPEYAMEASDKQERGTTITLYLDDESSDFANNARIEGLLSKYCKFMPIPIIFGKEQEWKDNAYVDTDKDKVINSVEPLWTKQPSELKEEDYMGFYRNLYPAKEEPLFYIHLNVDYPFNLTGILYFPKIKEKMALEKNNIQLYSNQMYVTDHVENIVPEFMTLLHGVIDSPDIPLNVSRSYLQSDSNVKKISSYITKKVADRLEEIYKNERSVFEEKWNDMRLFIEYGMLSDEKFCERALKFTLLQNTEGKFFSLDDYKKAVETEQTDKDKKLVYLYASNMDAQFPFIEAAKKKAYDVLLLDGDLDAHFINMLEQKLENVRFVRVDSDSVENLIVKEERKKPELSQQSKTDLNDMFKSILPAGREYVVEADNLGENAAPIIITQNEFMRRFREMSKIGGGLNFYGQMPESYNIIVNLEHPLMAKVYNSAKDVIPELPALPVADENASEEEKKNVEKEKQTILDAHKLKVEAFAKSNDKLRQMLDLALLANSMLKGKELTEFIERSYSVLK